MERSSRISELDSVQNPALGAYLLWQAGLSYQRERAEEIPFVLEFLVLPLVFHRQTLETINSTQKASGLVLFAAKLHQEDLLAIHERTKLLRDLTLRSIGTAVRAGLASVSYQAATVACRDVTKKPPAPPLRIKPLAVGVDRIATWFARLDLQQVATTLRVDY